MNYKITGLQDFNDLVVERVIGQQKNKAREILSAMFPGANIDIDIQPYVTYIRIDEVNLKLYS